MHGDIEDWKTGWYGVELGLGKREILALIDSLRVLLEDPDQHFHIDYKSNEQQETLGKVTFYVKSKDEPDNMELGSLAYQPGDAIR